MFRETNVSPRLYILWCRLLLRALVETVCRRIDQRKGLVLVKSKLGSTTTDVEFGHTTCKSQNCGLPVTTLCKFLSSKRYLLMRVLLVLTLVFALYQLISYLLYVTEFRKHVEIEAIAGYFQCQVNEAQVTSFNDEFACDFFPRPNPSDVIIVTFINSAWISLSRNWICSAEKAGLKDKLFLIGFEPNVCANLPGVACYEHPGISISGTSFGKPGYQRLMIERTKIILKLLSCGQSIALVDADITFLKYPFTYLDEIMEDKDIVFQSDSSGLKLLDSVLPYFFRYICGGFIYMRSSEPVKRLWLSVLHYQNNFYWNDQAGLNVCIRHHTHNVRWDVLDSEYFPNGRQYFYYNQTSDKNLIVHANHFMGHDKLVRMIAADLWCETQQGKIMCKSAPNFERHCIPRDVINKHSDPDPKEVRRRNYDPNVAPEWCSIIPPH